MKELSLIIILLLTAFLALGSNTPVLAFAGAPAAGGLAQRLKKGAANAYDKARAFGLQLFSQAEQLIIQRGGAVLGVGAANSINLWTPDGQDTFNVTTGSPGGNSSNPFYVDRIGPGKNPISFAVTRGAGLPAGFVITALANLAANDTERLITFTWDGVGTPGTYTFTVNGTDTVTGATGSVTYQVVVAAP